MKLLIGVTALLLMIGAAHAQLNHHGFIQVGGTTDGQGIVISGQPSAPSSSTQYNVLAWESTDNHLHVQCANGRRITVKENMTLPDCYDPEPMDVPAIYQKGRMTYQPDHCMLDNGSTERPTYGGLPKEKFPGHPICQPVDTSFWTCADKSRVLLTGEDGKKHCILFPTEAH